MTMKHTIFACTAFLMAFCLQVSEPVSAAQDLQIQVSPIYHVQALPKPDF
ncbi:MAG: hypothetical protein AB7E85_03190 [Pseudobdellovibrionaceae bacterium]